MTNNNCNTRRVFIDGDGCNTRSRVLIERLADRGVQVILVANRIIPLSNTCTIMHQCEVVPDAVDDYIVSQVGDGDLVITRDLVLALRILSLPEHNDTVSRVFVFSDVGEQYHVETIHARIVRSEHAKQRRATMALEGLSKKSGALPRGRVKKSSYTLLAQLLDQWVQGVL